jgi:predicted XRE-type DNA-binding protein
MRKQPSQRLTPEIADQIRRLKRVEGLYNHQIAALLNINQGRVSEVLTGKRHPEVKASQRTFDF